MVHFLEMGQLVADDVIDDGQRHEHQPPVQRNAAVVAATAPARAGRRQAQRRLADTEPRGMDGQPFGEYRAGFFAQGFFEQVTGGMRRIGAQVKRAGAELPAVTADIGECYGQRLAKAKNHGASGDLLLAGSRPVAPGGELVEHPLAVLVDQAFNVADARPRRRADAQAAVVDGQADGPALAAPQLVGDGLAGNDDAARRLRWRCARHPRSDAAKCGASRLRSRLRPAD